MRQFKRTNSVAREVYGMRKTMPWVTDLLRLGRAVAFKHLDRHTIRARARGILDYSEYPDMTEAEIIDHLYTLSQMDDRTVKNSPQEMA